METVDSGRSRMRGRGGVGRQCVAERGEVGRECVAEWDGVGRECVSRVVGSAMNAWRGRQDMRSNWEFCGPRSARVQTPPASLDPYWASDLGGSASYA